MTRHFVLAAQLSTGHSPASELTIDKVLPVLERALDIVPLDILVVGWEEIPDLYRVFTDAKTRGSAAVYLWYPLLSDYPGLESEHLVLDYRGEASQGWGDFVASGEMSETFRFSCPNNPGVRETTLSQLERLLTEYDFDGVFLDKFRFPSPANGLQEMLSCFCSHCYRAAGERGLDLDEVKEALAIAGRAHEPKEDDGFDLPGAPWLAQLLVGSPVLQSFLHFRCDSVTRLVTDVRALTDRLGKKLALDIFSPGLAPLVGQDYTALGDCCVWAKPMIYRRAKGPAGFRLELPLLIRDVARFVGVEAREALAWAQRWVPGLAGTDLTRIDRDGSPLALIADEARLAVDLLAPTPVYLGLETVSMPGIIEITPEGVSQIVALGREAGVSGVVMSWDLLHTPVENLRPLEAIV
jgi:hypothetical protein